MNNINKVDLEQMENIIANLNYISEDIKEDEVIELTKLVMKINDRILESQRMEKINE